MELHLPEEKQKSRLSRTGSPPEAITRLQNKYLQVLTMDPRLREGEGLKLRCRIFSPLTDVPASVCQLDKLCYFFDRLVLAVIRRNELYAAKVFEDILIVTIENCLL